MYRILVVDDERIITDGLCEILYNKLNCELEIYKAYSGIEALEILNKTRFDIVISDIRMPGIDGLQLLEKIIENWPKCKVILLTGHSEFEYVYKAIQYNQVSYILKTDGNRKLIKEVEKQLEKIEEELESLQILEEAKRQLDIAEKLLQKEYLNNLLKGEIDCEVSRQQQFVKLNLPLRSDKPLFLLIAQIDRLPEMITYSHKMKLLYSLKLLTERYFSSKVVHAGFIDDHYNLVWLLQLTEDHEENVDYIKVEEKKQRILNLGESMEIVQKTCRSSLNVTVSFIYSSNTFLWNRLSNKYSMLKQMLNRHMSISNEVILSENDINRGRTRSHSNLSYGRKNVNENILNTLMILLEKGDKKKFFSIFDRFAEELCKSSSLYNYIEQEAYYSISIRLLNYINRWNISTQIISNMDLSKLMKLDEHGSWNSAVKYLRQLSNTIFDIQQIEQNDSNIEIIKSVENYVRDHIHEDISLVKLAEVVNYNPSYLSRLFKQTRGINISEYINEEKIKKAKKLLQDPSIMINEIAAMVGHNSHANFSRFFKKHTNLSPQEYRNLALNK